MGVLRKDQLFAVVQVLRDVALGRGSIEFEQANHAPALGPGSFSLGGEDPHSNGRPLIHQGRVACYRLGSNDALDFTGEILLRPVG